MSEKKELYVLIGTLAGSFITGLFTFITSFLDKRQRKIEISEQIALEKNKFFTEKQREKSLVLCDQLELFRQLEEKYIEEVVSLRTKLKQEPNKAQSVKNEFRGKINSDENRISYSKSDYLTYKKYFSEIVNIPEEIK